MYKYESKVSVPVSDPFDPTYEVRPGGTTDAVVGVYNQFSRGSGAIIGDGHFVLTAAHVVYGESASEMQIAVDLASGRQYLDVSRVFVHPDYQPDESGFSSANDIAIIELVSQAPIAGYDIYRGGNELSSTFTLVGYGIAGTGAEGQLSASEDPDNGLVKRTGQNQYEVLDGQTFGDISFNDIFGETTPDSSLLFYDFDDGTAAHDAFGLLLGLNNTGLGTSEVNSTSGDSGGPNLINNQIAGIVSGGTTLSLEGASPDVDSLLNSSFGEVSFDTRVSYFQDWIDSIVGDVFNDGLEPGDLISGDGGDDTTAGGGGDDGGDEPVTSPFPLPLPGVPVEIELSGPSTTPPSDLPDDEFVYRFYDTTSHTHFYTSSDAERDNLIANRADFNYEGAVFRAGEPFYPGSVVVYRLLNTQTGGHLYTTDQLEMSVIRSTLPEYVEEGGAFRASSFPTGGMDPVYRFFNTDTSTHLYTTDELEKEVLIATNPSYNYEGIAWYALPV